MKDILIIAHFTQVPGETGNGRFHYIAENINKNKASVEVVTSSFSHRKKQKRKLNDEQLKKLNYKLTLLEEPKYKKNVSLHRFYSHYILGKNLKKYLKLRKKPDVIYCAVPSLSVSKIAAEYAKKNNIRFIIDIQDLWPEAFKMVLNIPVISNLIFYPMQKSANNIYTTADEIVAVSKTYLKRALEVNNTCKEVHSIYLGTDLAYFDKLALENKVNNKPHDEVWVVYIGTLGHSYDLINVIDGLKILKDEGIKNIKFLVLGDGPLKHKFEKYAKENGVYSHFTGRLDYGKMVGILKVCDIAVNPIKSGSAGSIINKVGDYAAAALPVLNTQEFIEYQDLITEYDSGWNIKNEDSYDFSLKLLALYKNERLRKKMGENNRTLAVDLFDRKVTYKQITDLMDK